MRSLLSKKAETRAELLDGLKSFSKDYSVYNGEIIVENYRVHVIGGGVLRVEELDEDTDVVDQFVCSVDEFIVNI